MSSPTSSAAIPDLASITAAQTLLLAELGAALPATSPAQLQAAARDLLAARRIFLLGAGRSGLALQLIAMRFTHLGLSAFVVGDSTTPAIAAGDLLLAASASGTTSTVVRAAQTAQSVGARILAFTTAPDSLLAQLAATVVLIPAASKSDTAGNDARRSRQYAGSLFEQAVLLLLDALFHALWQAGAPSGTPQTADDLLKRHSNLE